MTDALDAWRQYICRACGLVYDEELGDPDSGLAPGTRFADIPDDWECPVCGVTKADFEPYQRPRPVAAVTAVADAAPARRTPGLVIAGAGLAGWGVAEAVRALDATLPITVVTGCTGDVYHKPELSVALARGLSRERLARRSGAEQAVRLGVRLLADTFAVGLSPAVRRLRTTRGTLRYAHLVLALGARPALPRALPADLCWRVNDLDAWAGLSRALGDGPKDVAIVGAGMVGCELAEDAARAGHRVTLLDVGAGPLARLLPRPASDRLRRGLESLGVAFLGPVEVAAVERDGAGRRVTTRCGRSLRADVVVAATGLAAEPRLVTSAGLAFRNGIVVDPETLRTSAAGVYALGDCVSIDGAPCRFVEPIARQAEAIAHAILGRPHPGYAHQPPVIRLKTRSAPLVVHGVADPGGDWRTLRDDAGGLVMEQRRDGRVLARIVA